jgi:hypothetical protein
MHDFRLQENDINIIYKHRDSIKKMFDDLNNFTDLKRMSAHNVLATGGKLFCAFIAS